MGEITGPHGNRGEVKVIPLTDFPERFSRMEQVRLFKKEAREPHGVFALENCRVHKGRPILKLQGVDDLTKAEMLKKMLIKVSEAELMPLPPGHHYIFQLIGLECVTTEGVKLGVLTDVLQTGANDVYVLKPEPGVGKQREILIPATYEAVPEIDLEKNRLIVNLPEGLLD